MKISTNRNTYQWSWSGGVSTQDLEKVTERKYLEAFEAAKKNRTPFVIRIWNHIPAINEFYEGIENYQTFCKGRKTAFSKLGINEETYPAATAVGSQDQILSFKFLFSDRAPVRLSNPHQVEAFHYPLQHGPTPPSFSRGCVHDNDFYLSGTASIRGHETLHVQDIDSQLKLTFDNISVMLEKASEALERPILSSEMEWTIYFKHLTDLPRIEDFSKKIFTKTTYVQADICRMNLLVEIEGVFYGV